MQMIHISERNLEIQDLSLKNSKNFSHVLKSLHIANNHILRLYTVFL